MERIYFYDTQHRKTESVLLADYLPQSAVSNEAPFGDCLLNYLVPVNRSDLLHVTRKLCHAGSSCVRYDWRADMNGHLLKFKKCGLVFLQRLMWVLCFNDRLILPPILRSVVQYVYIPDILLQRK